VKIFYCDDDKKRLKTKLCRLWPDLANFLMQLPLGSDCLKQPLFSFFLFYTDVLSLMGSGGSIERSRSKWMPPYKVMDFFKTFFEFQVEHP